MSDLGHIDASHPLIMTVSVLSAFGALATPWWTPMLAEFRSDLPVTLQIAGLVLICVQIVYYWKRSR